MQQHPYLAPQALTCTDVRQVLESWRAGELDGQQAFLVEDHLLWCAPCAGEAEHANILTQALRTLPQLDVPNVVSERIAAARVPWWKRLLPDPAPVWGRMGLAMGALAAGVAWIIFALTPVSVPIAKHETAPPKSAPGIRHPGGTLPAPTHTTLAKATTRKSPATFTVASFVPPVLVTDPDQMRRGMMWSAPQTGTIGRTPKAPGVTAPTAPINTEKMPPAPASSALVAYHPEMKTGFGARMAPDSEHPVTAVMASYEAPVDSSAREALLRQHTDDALGRSEDAQFTVPSTLVASRTLPMRHVTNDAANPKSAGNKTPTDTDFDELKRSMKDAIAHQRGKTEPQTIVVSERANKQPSTFRLYSPTAK